MLRLDADLDSYSLLGLSCYCTPASACGLEVLPMVVSQAIERSKLQLPILKVRPGAVVEAVFGEVGPIWFGVHWIGNRQVLCGATQTQDCPLCGLTAGRVIGMTLVGCRLQGASRAFLLEVSPLAFSSLESRCRFSGLNLCDGVLCEVSRPRARGCLRIEPREAVGLGEQWLDAERRLVGGWAVLYGLPLPTLEETFTQFQERVASVIQARARVAEARPST